MATWKKVIVSGSNAVLNQVTASGGFSGDGSGLTGIVGTSANDFTNTLKSKLDAIEASATADQTATQIKTLVGTGNSKFVPAAGTSGHFLKHDGSFGIPAYTTNTNTTYSVQDGELSQNNFTNADHTKLNGIETSATADQTNAEIRTAVEAATNSNVFTDDDHTKLNGIEASATADQTAAQLRTAIGTGNGNLVPAAGTSGHFLKHDGSFGIPAYTTNTNTTYSVQDGELSQNNFTNADHSKLNGIETSATADQTAIEIINLLNSDLGGNKQIGNQASDLMTFGGSVTVTGDLTISGTTTTVDTANLAVTDQFIELNDGGSAADGGLVVAGAGTSFGWDNSAGRWAFDAAGATANQTSITSDAFAASVVTSDLAAYRKNGNIRVESNEIYIYVE